MRYLLLLSTFIVALFSAHNLDAAHNTGEIMFTSMLSGEAEVPAVQTNARGITSFELNSSMDTLFINGTYAGLSGKITSAHIHGAESGANGGVLIGLTSMIRGNQIKGFVTGDALSQTNIKAMLEGNTYLNIHTEENPAGEIRGQLMQETDFSFYSDLTTDAEVPPVQGDAEGFTNIIVSKTNQQVWVNAEFSGLTGAVTGAHLHNAASGSNGPVLVNLSNLVDGNTIKGMVEISDTLDLLTKLQDGEIYLNIHTEANASGELRGDLMAKEGLTFRADINTEQEVPEPIVSSNGHGNAYVYISPDMNEIEYMIYMQGLTGEATGAHFHLGAEGEAGPVELGITDDINGNWIVGSQSGAMVTAEFIQKMLQGQIYLNIHTMANAAGEIRGQVYPNTRIGLSSLLEGEQENPGIRTKAYGSGMVSISNNLNDIWYSFLADDLSGEVEAAHFHKAEFGQNGDVVLAVNDDIDQGNDNGVMIEGKNVADIDRDLAVDFVGNNIYLNMHTAKYPAGELRGQIDIMAKLYFDNGILPFDPMFSGRLSFNSKLSSENEVHTVSDNAMGTLGLSLSSNMDTLYYNATVNNLSGDITGAHFHIGTEGEDGPVAIDLTSNIRGKTVTGMTTEFDLNPLLKGDYYLNIHTEKNPKGEARGQVELNTDLAFIAKLSPDSEVHDVTSEAEGMAIIRIMPDMKTMEINVLFDNETSAVTGAHLHNAPEGEDGPVSVGLTSDIEVNKISTVKMDSSTVKAMMDGNIYLNIHTEDYPAGELRGQLMMKKGVFFDAWLNGAQENPSTETEARGLAAVYIDAETEELVYDLFTAGLENEISGTHIHKAKIGVNGSVIVDLTGGILDQIVNGTINLDASVNAEIETMLKGDSYLNVHTDMFPDGEIRGQLRAYNRESFTFNLSGNQEVPAVDNAVEATGIVSVSNMWDMVSVDITYTNPNNATITAAHIHEGKAGMNGGVLVNISDDLNTENQTIRGSYSAEAGVNDSLISLIMNGGAYINIHSEENPNGEMRGQIENSPLRSPTSVDNFVEFPSVNIYPNPTVNTIKLNIGEYISSADVMVRIYNNSGSIVREYEMNNNGSINLDVSSFNAGAYYIEVLGNDKNIRSMFIKQ